MAVDVRRVEGRRELEFSSYDDILQDAEQLMRRGTVRSLGNWTPGQNFEHLAKSIHASIDGVSYKLPLLVRGIAKLFKNWFLSHPLEPGIRFPVKLESDFGPRPTTTTEEGFHLLQAAIGRIKSTSTRAPSPAFGEMTESEWIQLHCRHAALHLSFLVND